MQHLWLQRSLCLARACFHSGEGRAVVLGHSLHDKTPQCAREDNLFVLCKCVSGEYWCPLHEVLAILGVL